MTFGIPILLTPGQINQLAGQTITALTTALRGQYQEILNKMTTLAEDVARLNAAVDANTVVVKKLMDIDTSDASLIADLKAQVAALSADGDAKAALEATITKLEANNAAATQVNPPVDGPVPAA